MGREVRRVPKNWEHPKDENGNYIPLLGYSFPEKLREWEERNQKWSEGFKWSYSEEAWEVIPKKFKHLTYEEYSGSKPKEEDYMPDWSERERTHWQMYEDTSEGTPISPVMKTPEELARWLADNNASAFADMTATYEQWLATIRRGSAISAIGFSGAGLMSGVAGEKYLDDLEKVNPNQKREIEME